MVTTVERNLDYDKMLAKALNILAHSMWSSLLSQNPFCNPLAG